MSKFSSIKSLESHKRHRVKKIISLKSTLDLGATENLKPNFHIFSLFFHIIFTYIPCILILSKFLIHQLMHK